MKKLILIFTLLINSLIFAKDIHIGDLIKLQIKSSENALNKEDIKKAFDPNVFYLEKIEGGDSDFTLNLRVFEPGVHEVDLKGNILKFDVKSALDDKTSTAISENMKNTENLDMLEFKPPFPLGIFYALSAILIISGSTYLFIRFKKKKSTKQLTPFQEFEKNISALNADSENFYELLSYSFRKYLDDKFGVNYLSGDYSKLPQSGIKDKFSELKGDFKIEGVLKKLDFYKFSPVSTVLGESRENLKTNIANIVKELEKHIFLQETLTENFQEKTSGSKGVEEYV